MTLLCVHFPIFLEDRHIINKAVLWNKGFDTFLSIFVLSPDIYLSRRLSN